MNAALRELIALSFCCGGALFLCPEGGTKRIVSLLCAALLTAAAIGPLREPDADLLSRLELRLEREQERIAQNGQESEELLRRLALEDNCARYLKSRAEALGLKDVRAQLVFTENESGAWLPAAVRFYGAGDAGSMRELRVILRDELGIPTENQEWYPDG